MVQRWAEGGDDALMSCCDRFITVTDTIHKLCLFNDLHFYLVRPSRRHRHLQIVKMMNKKHLEDKMCRTLRLYSATVLHYNAVFTFYFH